MNSNRKKTIIAGSLYIIGIIAGILSIAPAIDASDYLFKASANPNQILFAALFQFIMTIAYVGFAITLYPILRKYNACLKLVPVSLPFIVASPTTQTTTPPCFMILNNSFAIFSNSKEYPL